MKVMLWGVLLAALQLPALAAQPLHAITEDGRRVLLSEDGRWKFDTKMPSAATAAESPYQSPVKRFSVAYDTTKWTLVPAKDAQAAGKQMFRHKALPLYAVVIADEIPVRTESMKNVILENAASGGFQTQVLLDEIQETQGRTLGHIRMAATAKGVDFVFDGRYFGDADGNVQVMCYTGQQLFHKYQEECAQFLAGLTIR